MTLIAATLLAYSNALSSPFVLDDQDAVVTNETIRTISSSALQGPIQSSTAGRPLVNLSFALNYAIGGLDPRGYHAVNLALHIFCGLLIFGIVRRTLDLSNPSGVSNLFAFLTALVWLLHPIQSEVVDYVTQRTESMMALAFLTTLYAFVRGLRSERAIAWYGLSVAACALGMLCKESMVVAPVAVLLYDVAFGAGGVGKALGQRAVLYAGLAASYIVIAVIVSSGARSHSAGFSSGVSPWTYLLNQAPIIVRYLRLSMWPTSLVFDYGVVRPTTMMAVVPSGAVILAMLVGTAALWRVQKQLAYVTTWFFLTLAPTSSFVPIATEVGAERRMYLPLLALVVLAVLGLRAIASRAVVLASLGVAATVLAGLTFQRNADYHQPLTLWTQVVARYPHPRAHYNRGLDLKDGGRRDEAIREFTIAAPESADAQYALGFEAMNDGRHQEATEHFRKALQMAPLDINAIRASNLLGRSLLALGRNDEAIVAFRATFRMQPHNSDASAGLGQALLNQRRFNEALEPLNAALQTSDDPSIRFNLGLAFLNLRRFNEAATEFSKLAEVTPKNPAAHANLGTALAQLGRFDEAIAAFQRASAAEPDPAAREEIRAVVAQLQNERKRAGQR